MTRSLGVLFLLVACCREVTFTLTGRVVNRKGKVPVAGVLVYEKSHGMQRATTDSAGRYTLYKVSAEEHTVYVEKEGYELKKFIIYYRGDIEGDTVVRDVFLTKTGE